MNDLLLRALRCEETERRPLWIMRQAGRYLPEYRALKERHTFLELASDPELAAEVTLMPFERFAFDAAIVFADLMSPISALGIEFDFAPGPVLTEPLRSAADIRALPRPEPAAIAPEVPQAVAKVKAALDGRAALIGFAGAPLSLAAYLVEGSGSKAAFPRVRALAAEDPVAFGELLARLAELSAGFLIEQHRAGADLVQVFDSWAGIFSWREWEQHVQPHLSDLLSELSAAGIPTVLFAQGAAHLWNDLATLASDGLALDWRADLGELRRRFGPGKALQGNLDPAVLLAGPEATARATRELLSRVPARGHIVNLGHGITPEAPLESVAALIECVHAEQKLGT